MEGAGAAVIGFAVAIGADGFMATTSDCAAVTDRSAVTGARREGATVHGPSPAPGAGRGGARATVTLRAGGGGSTGTEPGPSRDASGATTRAASSAFTR